MEKCFFGGWLGFCPRVEGWLRGVPCLKGSRGVRWERVLRLVPMCARCVPIGDELAKNSVFSCVGLHECGKAVFVSCDEYGVGECGGYWVS